MQFGRRLNFNCYTEKFGLLVDIDIFIISSDDQRKESTFRCRCADSGLLNRWFYLPCNKTFDNHIVLRHGH